MQFSESIRIFYQTILNDFGSLAGIGVLLAAVTGWQIRKKVAKRTRPQIETKVKIRKVSSLYLNPDKIRWWEFWKK